MLTLHEMIDNMLIMHDVLINFWNPKHSFYQFLQKNMNYHIMAINFYFEMKSWIPTQPLGSGTTKAILFNEALELMPDTQGFSMFQYLNRQNKPLKIWLLDNFSLLVKIYLIYDEAQKLEQRKKEHRKKKELFYRFDPKPEPKQELKQEPEQENTQENKKEHSKRNFLGCAIL